MSRSSFAFAQQPMIGERLDHVANGDAKAVLVLGLDAGRDSWLVTDRGRPFWLPLGAVKLHGTAPVTIAPAPRPRPRTKVVGIDGEPVEELRPDEDSGG